jgi:hypothetical protein
MIAVFRTLVVSVMLGGLILAGFWRLSTDRRDRAIAELEALNEQMQQRLEQRQAMIERLSRSRRLAHVQVLEQRRGPEGVPETDILFIELDDDGSELARQAFTIPGDVLFIDAWSVKFAHEDVAMGHPLFGRALILLRRIYSDRMAPIDGYPIDTPGAVPPGYAMGEVGRFERQLWEQFWDIAADAELAASLGVRVAQGEAIYKPIAPGQSFELTVDDAGGMSLAPLLNAAPGNDAISQADG